MPDRLASSQTDRGTLARFAHGCSAVVLEKRALKAIFYLSDRVATKGQEIRHDRSGRVGSSVHLDVKLCSIDEAALEA
jgi:hypothetical protein